MSMATPSSAQRFNDRVAAYVRYRPSYPPQLLRWLHDELGVTPATAVADIGAGTGISSRLFLEAGHAVTAVEPNQAMRDAALQWLAEFPKFQAIDGTAEATGLADASVGLVSAAQAFHWFDMQAVHAEW
ncbi:SAM-dependent methyltransferase, partial [Xanthomonas perforans]